MITHRSRLLSALRHEETDRVPFDFGGGPATGIHPAAYRRLLGYLGIDDSGDTQLEIDEAEIRPGERLLALLDIDVRGVDLVGRRRVLAENSFLDDWGVNWGRASSDAPYIALRGPLQHLDDPSSDDLRTLRWPEQIEQSQLDLITRDVARLATESDCGVVLNLQNAAFSLAQRLRGFAEFLEDLLTRPRFASELMDRITDVIVGQSEQILTLTGNAIDCVSFADDMGTQSGPMISPEMYRSLVMRHHRRLISSIRRHSNAFVILHSDGAIADYAGDLVDSGIQVINPVQLSAKGMDPRDLKRRFGANLSFWGGIDTHRVLPWGSTFDVAQEVETRVRQLGAGGGYVLASVHQIMAEVPPENIVTMFNTAKTAAVGDCRNGTTAAGNGGRAFDA